MENANLLLLMPELDASCREDVSLLGLRIRSLGLLRGLAWPGLVMCAGLVHRISSPLLLMVLSLCSVVCKLRNLQIYYPSKQLKFEKKIHENLK